jgi:rod shape-determining protein MreC
MDMPVMVAEGLVGRVIEVSRHSSKVMLITDAESSVAAVDSRSRDFGVVKGVPAGRLSMKHVDARGDVKVGDIIVTSNISTVFPPGLPIGEVTRASRKEHDLFYHIEIEPAVDFSKIEEVFLVF